MCYTNLLFSSLIIFLYGLKSRYHYLYVYIFFPFLQEFVQDQNYSVVKQVYSYISSSFRRDIEDLNQHSERGNMSTFNSCSNKFCKLNIIFQKHQSLSYLNDWGKYTATYYFIIVANSIERHECTLLSIQGNFLDM